MSRLGSRYKGLIAQRMKQFDRVTLGNGTISPSTFNVTQSRAMANIGWGEINFIEGVIASNLFQLTVSPHATEPKVIRLFSNNVLKFGGTKTPKVYVRKYSDLIDLATDQSAEYVMKRAGTQDKHKILWGEVPNSIAQDLATEFGHHYTADWHNAPFAPTFKELSEFLWDNFEQPLSDDRTIAATITFHDQGGGGETRSYLAWHYDYEAEAIYGAGNLSMTFGVTDKEYEVAYDFDQHKGQSTDLEHGGVITTRVVQRVR